MLAASRRLELPAPTLTPFLPTVPLSVPHSGGWTMTWKWPGSIVASSALAATLLGMTAATAAAQATVSGTITAVGTNAPLVDVRVMIVGTSLVATSGPDGKYVI